MSPEVSDLREQLARRIHEVHQAEIKRLESARPGVWGKRSMDSALAQVNRVLADEVIRQMEWARELGIRWCEEQESYSWGRPGRIEDDLVGDPDAEPAHAQPLTLAPEDWKP